MSRSELVRRLAEFATRPLSRANGASPPSAATFGFDDRAPLARDAELHQSHDLFVWFEDTSARQREGRRGIAGLPEVLLPYARGTRVIERRYADGHLHLLSAVRIRCVDQFGERIAALYTAALSVGTVAWIGTGAQYARAWREMYPYSAANEDPDAPDFPSEI
jgi:hypothetical protein